MLFDARLKDVLQNIKDSYGLITLLMAWHLTFTNMGWLGLVTSVGQVIRVGLIKVAGLVQVG